MSNPSTTLRGREPQAPCLLAEAKRGVGGTARDSEHLLCDRPCPEGSSVNLRCFPRTCQHDGELINTLGFQGGNGRQGYGRVQSRASTQEETTQLSPVTAAVRGPLGRAPHDSLLRVGRLHGRPGIVGTLGKHRRMETWARGQGGSGFWGRFGAFAATSDATTVSQELRQGPMSHPKNVLAKAKHEDSS